jgi:hypothetical protein
MSNLVVTRWRALLAAGAAVACVALLAPVGAGAATVVNGNFESGLSGWTVQKAGPSTNGWFAYSGTSSPVSGHLIPAPPQGSNAAITDQDEPSSDILYQDVTLEPYWTHQLTMTLFYTSYNKIQIPNPDTLSWTGEPSEHELEPGQPNQQYRVDVMKPTAPVNSVNPSDILATVFATREGSPESMGPAQFSVNLTPFAGQTVRLRFAMTDNENFFNAGVDNVSLVSTPPSNVFVLGPSTLNRKKGTGSLSVTVPGAGSLSLTDARPAARIKPVTVATTAAGAAALSLTPTKAGRKALKNKGTLTEPVVVTFTPTGGFASTQTLSVTLKLKPKKHKKHHHKH